MLQDLGDKLKGNKLFMVLLLGPLVLLFAVWGATGVVNLSFGSSDYALKINGEKVAIATLQNAWQDQQARYQSLLKAEIPPAQQKAMQEELVQSFISRALIKQRATSRGFRISNDMVGDEIKSEPSFQTDGKYDPLKAREWLTLRGYTEQRFLDEQRESMQSSQLESGIAVGAFLTPRERARVLALENEQREVRFGELPLARYEPAAVDEATLKTWFQSHAGDYQTPEWADVDYAELSLDTIAAGQSVEESALQQWVEANKARYGTAERRRAAHILISVPAGADANAEAAALKKARELLSQARSGQDFGELARQNSADPGSARNGGDVGFTESKGAFDQAFTDALFKLKSGEISEPVRTRFGYHLIKLTELQAAGGKTLATHRAEIEKDYLRDHAAALFGERQERLQERLESGSGADLAALAREFELKTGNVAHYTRSNGGALGTNADLAAAIFGEEVRGGARVSAPVALGPERIVVAHVRRYVPVGTEAYNEVRASVLASVRREQGTKAAQAAADAAVKALDGGASVVATFKDLGTAAESARWVGRGDPQLPVQIRDAAFAMAPPPGGKSAFQVVPLEEGGVAVVGLSGVRPGVSSGNADADQKLLAPYAQRAREAELKAYLQHLQQGAKISRNDAKVFD